MAFAKGRKHSKEQIRAAIRKQLPYVRRDISYLEGYFSQGCVPDTRDIPNILTIFKLYEQQEYMYRNKVYSVSDRIVSISQPWIRPIVRGKVKAPVEFGAKLDVSIDSEGYGLEKVSFDAYNERGCLIGAVERYFSRNKRCYELGCIVTKPEETQLTSIALSVFVSNLFRIQKRILLRLFWKYFKYVPYINGYSPKAA